MVATVEGLHCIWTPNLDIGTSLNREASSLYFKQKLDSVYTQIPIRLAHSVNVCICLLSPSFPHGQSDGHFLRVSTTLATDPVHGQLLAGGAVLSGKVLGYSAPGLFRGV